MATVNDRASALGPADPASMETAVPDGPDRETALPPEIEAVANQTRTLVRERPFVAVAGAILAGFLVGRILSRR